MPKAALRRTDSGREVVDHDMVKQIEEKQKKDELVRIGALQRTASGREIVLD